MSPPAPPLQQIRRILDDVSAGGAIPADRLRTRRRGSSRPRLGPRSLAAPARAPGDWSLAPPAGCACDLCERLAGFLVRPDEERLEWPLAKKGRQHIHQRIDGSELPVRHETRRAGSPYTLILTKTAALFEREAEEREGWRADLEWLTGLG